MKKLLIFMLVLGLASVANATLQISVMGSHDPVETEITLVPSETIILDIWTDSDIAPPPVGGDVYYALAALVAEATISGGHALEPYASQTDLTVTIDDDAVGMGWVPLPPGENGVYGSVISTGGTIPANADIFDGIVYHCEDDGTLPHDVIVTLYEVDPSWAFVTPLDTVVIHQIPEPMTVVLLGLGGLFLRRRK